MSAKNDSHGQTATLSKESPSDRGRDGRKATQTDGSTATQNNPPNHGVPTHGVSRFLWEVDPNTPVSELGEKYEAWKRRQNAEQTDLAEWDDAE